MKRLTIVACALLCTMLFACRHPKSITINNYASDPTFQVLLKDTIPSDYFENMNGYECDKYLALPHGLKWKHPDKMEKLVELYNLHALDHAYWTDLDLYLRVCSGANDFANALKRVNLDAIADDSLRILYSDFIDAFIKVLKNGDEKYVNTTDDGTDYIEFYGPEVDVSDEAYSKIRNYYYEHSIDFPDSGTFSPDSLSPKRWLPDVYTTYVGENAEPTEVQLNDLRERMVIEKDFDTKLTLVFSMLGSINDEYDFQTIAEESMTAGIYSPMLDMVWRAYRVASHRVIFGHSTWSLIPNRQFNYYRRIIAYTMLRYIDDHPDDMAALTKFLYHTYRNDIMRFGEYSYGNQSSIEMYHLFWNEDIF